MQRDTKTEKHYTRFLKKKTRERAHPYKTRAKKSRHKTEPTAAAAGPKSTKARPMTERVGDTAGFGESFLLCGAAFSVARALCSFTEAQTHGMLHLCPRPATRMIAIK